MAEHGCPEVPDNAKEDVYHTLFVDTSLGTHMATIISDSATVYHVKAEKIISEHSQLFSGIGEIKIHSLQVKSQGQFYHLPDSMTLANAYVGSKPRKALFVEASTHVHTGQNAQCVVKKRKRECTPDLMEDSSSYPEPVTADKRHFLLSSGVHAVNPTAELGVNTTTSVMRHQSTNVNDQTSPIIGTFHDKDEVAIEAIDQSIQLGGSVANQIDKNVPVELAFNSENHVRPFGICKPSDQDHSPAVLETGNSKENLISESTKTRARKKVSGVKDTSVVEQSKTAVANPSIVPNIAAEDIGKLSQNLKPADGAKDLKFGGQLKQTNTNQEVLLPPTEVYATQESAAGISGNVGVVNQTWDNSIGADDALITGQPNNVEDPVLDQSGRRQEDERNLNRKEKPADEAETAKKEMIFSADLLVPTEAIAAVHSISTKTTVMTSGAKHLRSDGHLKKKRTKKSTASNHDDSRMEQTNAENSFVSVPTNLEVEEAMEARIPTQDVGKKTSESINVSAPVHQRELTEVNPNEENTANMDKHVREVVIFNQSRDENEGANEMLLTGQPDDVRDRMQENGNLNKNEKKKRKKGQVSAGDNLSNSDMKGQNLKIESLAASGNAIKGTDSSRGTTKVRNSSKGGTAKQSNVPQFEIEKDTGIELDDARPENGTEFSDESNFGTAQEADGGINFRDYFVRGESQNEVASQSVKSTKKKDKGSEVTEKTKLSETLGKGKSSNGTNANDKKIEEYDGKLNKNSIASRDEVKGSTSNKVAGNKTLEKAVKSAIASRAGATRAGLQEKNGPLTAHGSSLRSEDAGEVVQNASNARQQSRFNRNAVSTRKGSSDGNVLKSSGREKSLLTTERKLFTDSESSSDDSNIQNSDSSTRTPSENSSSSGSSSGEESDFSQDSKRKGSDNANTKNGASSKRISGSQHMSMDMVLRSSSRFKKAKLKASQSQEVELDDSVPDSGAKV